MIAWSYWHSHSFASVANVELPEEPTVNLLIFGSCVTRDTVPLLEAEGHRLCLYVARQSVTSIGHPVADPHFTDRHLDSPFQERMYRGDLAGNALTRIIEAQAAYEGPCALVWDLTDERGGILCDASGAVLTRTSDAAGAGFLDDVPERWNRHNFGSLQHWLMFKEAAEDFADVLHRIGLWERTLVLDNRWAQVDADGHATPQSLGLAATTANGALSTYIDLLRSLGWRIATPDIAPVADAHHRWGLTPFHYTDEFYGSIARAILSHLDGQSIPQHVWTKAHMADSTDCRTVRR